MKQAFKLAFGLLLTLGLTWLYFFLFGTREEYVIIWMMALIGTFLGPVLAKFFRRA
ncbi:MAG TPA: hypothetical protein VHN20_05195 [Beijerinckiaceae bacterium]|nr:hypothetical protein [Beijerinckiaceae bacterium]